MASSSTSSSTHDSVLFDISPMRPGAPVQDRRTTRTSLVSFLRDLVNGRPKTPPRPTVPTPRGMALSDDKENVQPAYNYFPYPSGADVGRDATLPSSSFESGRASLGSTGAEAEAEAKEVLPETDEQKEMRRRD